MRMAPRFPVKLRQACLLGFFCISSLMQNGLANSAELDTNGKLGDIFIMGIDESVGPDTVYTRLWIRNVYDEAFRRLGMQIKYQAYPTARLTLSLEQGLIDGDSARAHVYGIVHPNLIRVEEALYIASFSLFGSDSSMELTELEQLKNGNSQVEYRRGVGVCENTMKALLPATRLSEISSTHQGLQKLLLKRTQYFCEIDVAVLNVLYSAQFKDAHRIRKLLDIGGPAPLYPYLNNKHAALAPKLAEIIRKMKAEGLIERYRQDALHELGH